MRISDWSSDVCSSDLFKKSDDGRWTCKARMIVQTSENTFEDESHYAVNNYESGFEVEVDDDAAPLLNRVNGVYVRIANAEAAKQIGRASCRERVGKYV